MARLQRGQGLLSLGPRHPKLAWVLRFIRVKRRIDVKTQPD
jgi:hypothetical protein